MKPTTTVATITIHLEKLDDVIPARVFHIYRIPETGRFSVFEEDGEDWANSGEYQDFASPREAFDSNFQTSSSTGIMLELDNELGSVETDMKFNPEKYK